MPELPVVPNVVEFIFQIVGGSMVVHVKLHWAYTGPAPVQAATTNFALTARQAYATNLASLHVAGTVLAQTNCIDLSSKSGTIGVDTTGVAGTRVGTLVPNNVCVVTDYLIHRRYRGGKPRSYWPWGTQNDMSAQEDWLPAFRDAVNAGLNGFSTALNGHASNGTTLSSQCSVSYFKGFTTYEGSGGRPKTRATLRPTPVVDPVVGHSVRTLIGTQRRRVAA